MKNKREWFKTEIKELIAMYQRRPELWDFNSPIYKNRAKKNEALMEIAKKFSTSTQEIQRKLHTLRNQLNNEFKRSKMKNSGSADKQYHSQWPYYHLLSFIPRLAMGSNYIGNLSKGTVEEEAPYETNSISDVPHATLEQHSDEICTDVTPISNLADVTPKTREIDVSRNDASIIKATRPLDEEGQFDIFGKYIASEMRSLSSEYLRKKMKRQIQEVILRINLEDEQLSNPESSFCSVTHLAPTVSGNINWHENTLQYTSSQLPETIETEIKTESI